ncbi:MAG: tetratricopeptide repeat protein, partial [Alphaproteobacteria bacterium]|nr:tetratricopeptide repeat protein [Alphaproteobacteria bacterium]
MPGNRVETNNQGFLARHWGKATAFIIAVSTLVGAYDTVRNKGNLFVCDLAEIFGQRQAVAVCHARETPPNEGNLLALLEYLKAREDKLDDQRRAQLRRLEKSFEERAFDKLMKAAGLKEAPVDKKAELDTRKAVKEAIEEGAAEERRAVALIAEGKYHEGLQLLSERALAATQENAAQWRRIGRLAYGVDTSRALDAYEKAYALEKTVTWDAVYLSRLHMRAGAVAKAHRTIADALGRIPAAEERDRSVLLDELGNVLRDQGDLAGAAKSYRAGLEIRKRLAGRDPDNAGGQHDLSVSHDRIGDVLWAQGDLSGAAKSYRASLEIRKRLAGQDPENTSWQRDLSVSHDSIGDVLRAQGDLSGAAKNYRAGLEIAERLAARDPENTGWQRDLSVSHERIGDVHRARVIWRARRRATVRVLKFANIWRRGILTMPVGSTICLSAKRRSAMFCGIRVIWPARRRATAPALRSANVWRHGIRTMP